MSIVKKILLISGGLFVLMIIICILYIFIPRKDLKIVIDSSEIIPYLADGDIILRKSNAGWADIFSRFSLTDRRFSHLGIVRIHNGNITVINSVGHISDSEEGVHEVSLEGFLRVAISIGVFRSKYIDGTLISDKAVEYLGLPFDWDFDINDGSKIYCTELLYAVLNSVAPEYNLETRYMDIINMEIIPLDSVSASENFEEILYLVLPLQ